MLNKELIVTLIISLIVHLGVISFPGKKSKVGLEVTRSLSSLDVIVVKALSREKVSPEETVKPEKENVRYNMLQKDTIQPKEIMITDTNPEQGRPHLKDIEKPLLTSGPDFEKRYISNENWNSSNERGSLTTSKPMYLKNSAPPYPLIARRNGYEGTAALSVKVMPDGTVGEVRVIQSSKYKILDSTAIESVKDWIFIPAMRMGIPVEEWVIIPIRFQLKE